MSTTTTNYKLVKPALSDPADITAMNPNWDKIDSELHNLNSKCVTATSSDGKAYTATVPGVTALYTGLEITIIPNTNSTATGVTINVNNLGAKNVRLPIGTNTSSTSTASLTNWLSADKPVKIMYNGTLWVTSSMQRQSAAGLYGQVAIANGGTGATNLTNARKNLGISSTRVDVTIDAWSATMTFSNDAITETCVIEILPGVDITLDQLKALQKAQIVGSTQVEGELTYKCLGTVPSIDIPVTFIIRGDL